MKYRCDVVNKDGNVFYFITKRAAFSTPQIEAIISDVISKNVPTYKPEEYVPSFKLPGNKNIFLNDIRSGMKHCVEKYGVTEEAIIKEAMAHFPDSDVKRILGV